MNDMKLTEKERAMVHAIVKNEFTSGNPEDATWTWAICGSKAKAAVLGSLVKKRLVWQSGSGLDASCGLTKAGQALYRDMAAAATG